MRIFDTNVQKIKYEVLKEVIRNKYENIYLNEYYDIPRTIAPGPKALSRCCIFKERAVLEEYIKLSNGGNIEIDNVIEVISIACDECPAGGILVTPACRGCIVHNCKEVCPRGAIEIVDGKSRVDKSKCIECGKCVTACPYNALIMQHRPCKQACPVNAISVDENDITKIDQTKCISCGSCVYKCPFGAISDKSYINETIDILKKSNNNTNYKVYAVIAPSIYSQFKYAKAESVVSGIRQLGFHDVIEAALGADVALDHETDEWLEKKTLITSCCPAFVSYVEKNFPELVKYVSSAPSPMVVTAKFIKSMDKTAKVVFIGPCTAKKLEYKLEKTSNLIDSVFSFEELQAFLDARRINVESLSENPLNNASYYGRIFAKSGGISQGISHVAERKGITGLKPLVMNGLNECKIGLTKLKFNKCEENFFEGMACIGGCINGALCLNHTDKNAIDIEKYGQQAKETEIDNSIRLYNLATSKK
ncbi:MAG: monomeric [FeFe] hydrogenase [Acholeplasmatales bacterium]|jgi:[FeFe] hydrogenase (group B1/B3)|nr:monomeric [FeFe] hydrogenase [Acholeplasmatales bacterium]